MLHIREHTHTHVKRDRDFRPPDFAIDRISASLTFNMIFFLMNLKLESFPSAKAALVLIRNGFRAPTMDTSTSCVAKESRFFVENSGMFDDIEKPPQPN